MIKTAPIIFTIAIVLVLFSCKSGAKIQDGETAYQYKKYLLAADLLQKDFSKAKTTQEQTKIALKIADSYDKQLDYANAESWYKKMADLRVQNDAVFLYLNALKRNEKYQEALSYLDTYLKANKSEKFRLQKEYEFLENVIKEQKKRALVKFNNLNFNTTTLDFAPFLKNDIMYITSTQTSKNAMKDDWSGQNYTDIYEVNKINNHTFSSPIALSSPINSDYHDAELVLSKNGKIAYFTRCLPKEKNTNAYCHIYKTTKNIDDTWSEPERLVLFADTINEGQAYLSPDDSELYFVSDSKDGYGGKDIFLAKINNAGNYEYPINAGSKVNTQGDELFPVIATDNKLYFSSNGKIGYGGLDIYMATKEGKIYTNVQNLGYGINSGGDDFSMALIKPSDDSVLLCGYLTSNRKGGNGLDDIYYFEKRMAPAEPLPPAIFVLKTLVQTKKYQNENNPNSLYLGLVPIDQANVVVHNLEEVKSTNQPFLTNIEGTTQTILPKGKNYTLKVSKSGFLATEENVTTNLPAKDGDTIIIQKTITLDKIYQDVEITLNNIYYDYNKWNIRADAAQSLDTLVFILQNNPTIKIQLSAHTDCRGSDVYNQTLSQKRAESVVQYLISKGISTNRLTAKGYGETMPIETCVCEKCNDEQHQINRRTTFKIVSE